MQYLSRLLEHRILAAAAHFPVIVITGARQVGKSTLAAHLFGAGARQFVFDPVQDLYGSRRDPELFLDQNPPPLILDEVQYARELLPGIKRRVDARPGPGQYILTGSQNLGVLRGVAESLAGRAAVLDLEPMCGVERLGLGDSPGWLGAWLRDPVAFMDSPPANRHGENLYRAIWRGGFPGLLGKPDELVRDVFQSYVRTYLERDVRLAAEVRDEGEFARFLGLCAALTAQEVNHSQLGREIGVTPQTAGRWLSVLSATYAWLEVPSYHGSAVKRVSRRPKGHIVDSGLAAYLQRLSGPEALPVHPMLGALFETMVAGEIRRMAAATDRSPGMYHWRSHGGAEVDLVLDLDGALWPVEIKCTTRITPAHERGFAALRATYPAVRFSPNLIVAPVAAPLRLSRDTLVIPWDLF